MAAFPKECFTNKIIEENGGNVGRGWYRVVGEMNSLAIHQSHAAELCDEMHSGTLVGEHPSVEEGVIESKICFRRCSGGSCDSCLREETVYVRNCRTHFVYWISPTGHSETYCTAINTLTPVLDSSNAVECFRHNYLESATEDDMLEGWYRFSATSGLELASRCYADKGWAGSTCSSRIFRGWIDDSAGVPGRGRSVRRVCFSYARECSCSFYTSLMVRNCGGFFVYRVKRPPIEGAAYCGVPQGSVLSPNSANAEADAGTLPVQSSLLQPLWEPENMCAKYEMLYDPDRLWSSTSPNGESCDAGLYGSYRFGSIFTPWSMKVGCNTSDMSLFTHRCGSRYQGFFVEEEGKEEGDVGGNPGPGEGAVQRIVCFQDAVISPCECIFTTVAVVRNCGDYFVYGFRGTPRCHARYCMVANASSKITIDPGRPPMYGMPRPKALTGDSSIKTSGVVQKDEKPWMTVTLISAVLLFGLVLVFGVSAVLFFYLWRMRTNKYESDTTALTTSPPSFQTSSWFQVDDKNDVTSEHKYAVDENDDEKFG